MPPRHLHVVPSAQVPQLGPDEPDRKGEGRTKRVRRCECGYWHNFCERLELDDTSRYLQTIPYPHDVRCGCQICPDCRPNDPCATCHGSCCVCTSSYTRRSKTTDSGPDFRPTRPELQSGSRHSVRESPFPDSTGKGNRGAGGGGPRISASGLVPLSGLRVPGAADARRPSRRAAEARQVP